MICGLDAEGSQNYWRELVYDDREYDHERYDSIVQPCSVQDINCIRRFFAHNSQCSPVYGPTPDPYKVKTLPLQIPHANLSFTLNDNQINGFNDWKIETFYINKETNKLVFEVVFASLDVYSADAIIKYRRRGKEPIVLSDYAFINYKDLSLTMTVPLVRHIELSNAYVHTFISDAAPKYGLGPAFTKSKDPTVVATNAKLIGDIGVSLREAFLVQAPVFFSIFLQSSICDFRQIKY